MVGEMEYYIRLIVATLLGAIVGIERERMEKPAGLRTHMLVSLASALLAILSYLAFPGSDPARLIAGMVAGMGFIGGGTILKTKDKVVGVTTAASILLASAVGIAVGAGFYKLAVFATAIAYFVLELKDVEARMK